MSSLPKQSPHATIQSVQRALAILRCFTREDTELGVTHISKQLALHKSTVSRLLSTLEQEGFVEKNPVTEKYRLGLQLVTLAGIALEQIDLREVAAPYLSQLAEVTQETVNIVVLSGNECMNIDGAASPRPIRYVGRIGRRTPCHCTAAGKVLLAYLPPEAQQQILPNPLTRFTDKTIIDFDVLRQALAKIYAQGYAITHEEHQTDLSAVAAPIFDHSERVVAAVTVSGPTYRIGPGKIEPLIAPVQQIANEISARLGSVAR
ncbi:MAG: IclR family transcriptional regulator [Anaerolineae bacterium]|nr:IclR family transcriptional regulator [Anaerolineae bacterium]